MSMNKSSKMLNYVNARMRVTIQDSRDLVGTFMAFDKHMNIVLGETEEFRRFKSKNAEGKLEEREEKRYLGLVLLRGENVVSLRIESRPKTAKTATTTTGPGTSKPIPGGRGQPLPPATTLAGPVRGIGGPGTATMMPSSMNARPVLSSSSSSSSTPMMMMPPPPPNMMMMPPPPGGMVLPPRPQMMPPNMPYPPGMIIPSGMPSLPTPRPPM